MISFFEQRGYSLTPLQCHLDAIQLINCTEVLNNHNPSIMFWRGIPWFWIPANLVLGWRHLVSVTTFFQAPRSSIHWHQQGFYLLSIWIIHGIPCCLCPANWAHTWATFQRSPLEYREILPGFAIAKHCNAAGHSIEDVLVRGILLWGVTSQRKQLELPLIFKLRTRHPSGILSLGSAHAL